MILISSRTAFLLAIALTLSLLTACQPSQRLISSSALNESPLGAAAYAQRLQAMWLGATIANWTGLTTEGLVNEPPFLTDDDWGKEMPIRWDLSQSQDIRFVIQDPWLADDDTDIEYVYLHLIDESGSSLLTAEQIAAGWQAHLNDWIWVSNAYARTLMDDGAVPPLTSMLSLNPDSLAIDAQLTTEIFGALAPGMPERALRIADLPIRTTSSGYATHAAQFHVLLYSLATQADPSLPPSERNVWLVTEARKYIPDSSKTADIIDFVLADYQSNPDSEEWESTRDKVYERYHRDAAQHGFVYRDWTESSVNLATGLIALLYGGGDFKRTVEIGTLSGWDSDNGTSTMGGLLGLMHGYDALIAQFPNEEISDRYRVYRTRPTLPDHLLTDLEAQDTFAEMAARMLPYVEENIVAAGGQVADGVYLIPDPTAASPQLNPVVQIYERSQNNQIRQSGGDVTATLNGHPAPSLVDGIEYDYSGREISVEPTVIQLPTQEGPHIIEVDYSQIVEAKSVQLVVVGDGISAIEIDFRVGDNEWRPAEVDEGLSSLPSNRQIEELEFVLQSPLEIDGLRVRLHSIDDVVQYELVELDVFR